MESAEEGGNEKQHDKHILPFVNLCALGHFVTDSLHEAVSRCHADIVKRLLVKGADPMEKAGDKGDTAVHVAAWKGKSSIMWLLFGFEGKKKLESLSADDRSHAIRYIMEPNDAGDSPLHIAAKHGHGTIVHLLLSLYAAEKAGASLDTAFEGKFSEDIWLDALPAITQTNDKKETPLHIAARCGNSNVMEALLGLVDAKESFESAVAKCADTSLKAHRKDRTRLAKPRHALFGAQPLVKEKDAEKERKREEHLRELFDSETLETEDEKALTPLELVAVGGRCPEDDVCWFVTCYCASQSPLLLQKKSDYDHEGVSCLLSNIRARFVDVAKGFPAAASNLLQIANESGEGEEFGDFGALDPRYLRCLREAFIYDSQNGKVFGIFSELVQDAPQAASLVLDVVTYTPDDTDPHQNPMPRRFIPPRSDLYPLTCAYEGDQEWRLEQNGKQPEWHWRLKNGIDLVPDQQWRSKNRGDSGSKSDWWGDCFGREDKCPSNYIACAVYVVHLKGLAQPAVLNGLAGLADDSMFTKLQVLALLQFVWQQFRCLFIQDMVYEGVAIIVLSRWTFDPRSSVFESSEDSAFASRLSWTFVAGQGVLEATILLWTALRHLQTKVGCFAMLKWAMRNVHRILLSMLTIGLAVASTEHHWPDITNNMNVALGTTSLWHWLTMLYKIRAFVKTGTRLLPIMKTITPMSGMLVILAFLLVGIIHVFWAWERGTFEEASTWKFLTFLFIGDNFITDKFMLDNDMSTSRQWFLMILGGSSVFVFTCWTLNLFIAVLSEVYEQEQERMLVTFLRERACICSFLSLRPQWKLPPTWRVGKLNGVGRSHGWVEALGLFLIGASSIITGTLVCMLFEISNWPVAMLLAFWAVLQQALMHDDLTTGWEEKYLWYCTDTSGAEELFSLGHRPQDQMFPQSRAWKLKGYITEVLSRLEQQDNVIARLEEKTKKILNIVHEKKDGCDEPGTPGDEMGACNVSSQMSQPDCEPQDATHDSEEVFERGCSEGSKPVDETQKAPTRSSQAEPVDGVKRRKGAKAKRKPHEQSSTGT